MIEHNFTYNVPDLFGTVATENGLTEDATYHGPEFFYVTLDENNKVYTTDDILVKDEFTDQELVDNFRDGKPCVLVDAKEHPLVAYLLAELPEEEQEEEEDNLVEKHYTLEGETEPFFSHAMPIGIDEIYHEDNIIYDPEQETFIVPMIDHSQRDNYFQRRDDNIADATQLIQSGTLNKVEATALKEYIDAFTDIEITYADWPQHMWPTPDWPLGQEPDEGDPDHPDYVAVNDDDSEIDDSE